MMITQDLTAETLDFINPWGLMLMSIAWAVRAAHHTSTIVGYTPAQLV